MKAFVALYEALDQTMSTHGKIAAMVDYFRNATNEDAAWAMFFLTGRRLKRFISSRLLTQWFLESSGMAEWLFKECYIAVGDTAEAIALLNDSIIHSQLAMDPLPSTETQNTAEKLEVVEQWTLSVWMDEKILPLIREEEGAQRNQVTRWWRALGINEVFILNKLLTGALRVGVSQKLLVRALAEVSGLEPSVMAHRLMGNWEPTGSFYESLMAASESQTDISRPYPFYLASPLEQDPEALGNIADWQIEWKWDGIRAQLIRRDAPDSPLSENPVFIWSRGEELLNGRFPELEEISLLLPSGTVIDGEVLAHQSGSPLPFSVLQTRIGRKTLSKKILAEAPVIFMAYDLLETGGVDIREKPLRERRKILSEILSGLAESPLGDLLEPRSPLMLSSAVPAESWGVAATLREESRERQVEGFVLKHLDSTYQSGRKKGAWWKWKIDPLTVDAVLIYAQAGTGRRANLFTDYTFAVWQDDRLVPVAKAYSGLSNEEIEKLDRWIRANTQEKFGPVRSVKPHHVFELAFEGISESKRHKSGVALRFPRILRWRADKPLKEADTLDTLTALIHAS